MSKYNAAVDCFRETEYPMLQDSTYLDHAGTALCPKSLMDAFHSDMISNLYGNPHSSSSPSQLSTSRIEDVRMHLLSLFNADPEDYDLVFVANATAGVKLVVEAMRSQSRGFLHFYHEACHTSLVGAREEALTSFCLDDNSVRSFLGGTRPISDQDQGGTTTLFAYSAQSHMDGRRYPLSWCKTLKDRHHTTDSPLYTLLDASSFSATSPLDLRNPSIIPDFVVASLYKIFGFPDLGALLVRRSAWSVFDHRKYFGGGTVDMVVCGKEQWHASKGHALHERLEDGTLPFHSIVAAGIALEVHTKLFGSMDAIHSHTSYLTQRLYDGLSELRHVNNKPVCHIYSKNPENEILRIGPLISFNIRNSVGAWVSLVEFEKLAILKKMHVRTGGLCSPGSIASALQLQPWEMKRNFSAGFRCGNDVDIFAGKPTGVIRASLGAMNTKSDVDNFVNFIKEFFLETKLPVSSDDAIEACVSRPSVGLRVKAITVYPIKSCGGFAVPAGSSWGLRPEGLAWDREWCLVHQGSGQALSQKRYPRMALLQPSLDFDSGLLRVVNRGNGNDNILEGISIPLSADPSFVDADFRQTLSRVCGDSVSAQKYTSEVINGFFSKALGVPCVLARFPPGGRGTSSRTSKAQMQKHQLPRKEPQRLPGAFPGVPSPPDSDSEQARPSSILLSNESPILMIHSASVNALNREIKSRGGECIDDRAFRANIVLEAAPDMEQRSAYSEDSWKSIRIGKHSFEFLGACRRCQMVCVDQETAEKREEPYVTLAKTRRFDGKVYFGAHMRHDPQGQSDHMSREKQYPTIQVGDLVSVDMLD